MSDVGETAGVCEQKQNFIRTYESSFIGGFLILFGTRMADGHTGTEILEAILEVFPLDTYVDMPVTLMEKVPDDTVETLIWEAYKQMIRRFDERGEKAVSNIERFAFYEAAKTAYAIIATGESVLYANIMLQNGVVVEDKEVMS